MNLLENIEITFPEPQSGEADPCELLLTDATVELTLDNTQNNQKKEPAKTSNPAPSIEVAASSSSRNAAKSCEEVRIAPSFPTHHAGLGLELAGTCSLTCKHAS